MKILITGGSGFIAREIKPYLERKDWEVLNPSRTELDVSRQEELLKYFELNPNIDVVIHTAVRGGRRTVVDTNDIILYNWGMFSNLKKCLTELNLYKKLIHLGSGAALDRFKDVDENSVLGRYIPDDYYGLSKYLIENTICSLNDPRMVNVRIFGCFGFSEQEDRLIHANLRKAILGEPLIIHQDKFMDFIYVEDLVSILINIIEGEISEISLDACYEQKFLLSDIAKIILEVTDSKSEIIIQNNYPGKSYCGKSSISAQGPRKGIEDFCLHLKNIP